jgi:uncharacterized protein YcbX
MSLKDRLEALDGPVDIPLSFYLLPVLVIFTVTGIPLLYRRAWVFLYDLISDVRKDFSPGLPPRGCKRVGWDGARNLSKERFEGEYQKHPRHANFPEPGTKQLAGEALNAQSGRIEALFLHPIKSTFPIEVDSVTVAETGLLYDRLFSFAQLTSSLPDLDGNVTHSWVFVTQRSHSRLALVKTELWVPDEDAEEADDEEESEWVKNGGCVVVHFPFTPDFTFTRDGLRNLLVIWLTRITKSFWAEPLTTFRLPLNPSPERIKSKNYSLEPMKIWREHPTAFNLQSELPEDTWDRLKFHLGIGNPLTIFRIQSGNERELYKCAPGQDKVNYQPKVGFQDSYPVHVQNLESIRAVEKEVMSKQKGYKADARRFRANMYVSGPKAFVEHNHLRMAFQGPSSGDGPPEPIVFALPTRTPRCTMPNVDPATASKDKSNQPLKHLKDELVIDKGTNSPILGMHAVPMGDAIGRTVHVKDEVLFYKEGTDKLLYNKDPAKEAWTEIW